MTSFLVVVVTKMVVKEKKEKVVWRSQKQVMTFLGRGHDQFGPKKLVVTFWSGATKPDGVRWNDGINFLFVLFV